MKKLIPLLVVFFILAILLVFALISVLAEPSDTTTLTGYIAIKAVAFFVMVVSYKSIVALYSIYKQA